jgi:hypothetical protein
MIDQVLDDFEVSIEAGGTQGRRVGARGAVDSSVVSDEQPHDAHVARGRRAPQRWCSFDRLAVKDNCNARHNGEEN